MQSNNSSEPSRKRARISSSRCSKEVIESLEMALKRTTMNNETNTPVEQEDQVMEAISSEPEVNYLSSNGYNQDEWEAEDNVDILQLVGDMINEEEEESQSTSESEEENSDFDLLQEESYEATYDARGKKKQLIRH
ncbi:MAG: hypothetical protein RSC48_07670 [Anaerorhabdus sp.]